MDYTKEYFIEKFQNIPDEKWGRGFDKGCVLAQCGMDGSTLESTEEASALMRLIAVNIDTIFAKVKGLKEIYDKYISSYVDNGSMTTIFIINDLSSKINLTPKQCIIKCLQYCEDGK